MLWFIEMNTKSVEEILFVACKTQVPKKIQSLLR